jgi:hypothetical protein
VGEDDSPKPEKSPLILQVMKQGPSSSIAAQQKSDTRRNVLLNLTNCRGEAETLAQLAKSKQIKEAKDANEGNLFWFGLALRDVDIQFLKTRSCLINRYPLMDVSQHQRTVLLSLTYLFIAFC